MDDVGAIEKGNAFLRSPSSEASLALWYDPCVIAMTITLNGDKHELTAPVSVSELLKQLEIDARRVAVELNLAVVKKAAYDSSVIRDGDEVEIVNFVGGG